MQVDAVEPPCSATGQAAWAGADFSLGAKLEQVGLILGRYRSGEVADRYRLSIADEDIDAYRIPVVGILRFGNKHGSDRTVIGEFMTEYSPVSDETQGWLVV
ncbi:hypothetical protein DFR76_115118 [Nocardia pseudobrasiliensis]|uniref:Uncharacterized protein n=1 Tax=Nocardia pseudobrasiliensis TaxID=45979 RepID=A0A370HPR7_9NOCA|nr:hypothetical protein DFR76_115118 [Nocardia pseudobrasiliensis]